MYHALYVFTLLFRKLFSHLSGIVEGYSLWINSYTNTTEYAWNVIQQRIVVNWDVAT